MVFIFYFHFLFLQTTFNNIAHTEKTGVCKQNVGSETSSCEKHSIENNKPFYFLSNSECVLMLDGETCITATGTSKKECDTEKSA